LGVVFIALDGRLLARARAALEAKRRRKDELLERRTDNVYAWAPRIRALDAEIRESMSDLVGVALGANDEDQLEDIRLKNLELQEQRLAELKRAGFSEGYLSDEHMCRKCGDSGYVRTEMCACLMELYIEEQRGALSNLLKLGNETFDSFDLSYYDEAPAPDTGVSPRRNMEIIYETCVEYARKFGVKAMNLFFNGAPGLGKTFLSACIARVVADCGYSVVYDMASTLFARFEDVKFSRTDDQEEARAEVRRYLECDLLIIDDLGTELVTAFTKSVLYEIVNTRLITGKKTIISTNMSQEELRSNYTEQIVSRLEGEYTVREFRGEDIRQIKS